MSLFDIYYGQQTWADYLQSLMQLSPVDEAPQRSTALQFFAPTEQPAESMKVPLSPHDYPIALESGLGALALQSDGDADGPTLDLELRLDKLAGGMDQLNADFNLLLGDLIWKLEMREKTLDHVLREIRLAEFEREARAYRSRAERAYLNGWYAEALADFLEAEKRNYPDFAVHRSTASIFLYHLIDLPRAFEYFCKAAKYARPSDLRQAAEAHYFAAIVCVLERRLDAAAEQLEEATSLNPKFYEAYYQRACLSSLREDRAGVITSLEIAIKGDPRYYERAKTDTAFAESRAPVEDLLARLMQPVQEKLIAVKHDVEIQDGYVIAKPVEERITRVFRDIEAKMAEAKTYRSGIETLDALAHIQQQLKNLQHLFYKQYQIAINDYVRVLAFSPDGRWLAAGFLNGSIKIWEVSSGISVLHLQGHLAGVNSVAFSPNKVWLASGSRDKTIRLWNGETGREIHTMHGHAGDVRAVAFSPDGEWLISGSHDRTLRVWRVITGRQVQILGEHTHHITSALYSPDGDVIASGSLDKTIRIWDAKSGSTIRILRGHTKGVQSLAFSPDGKLLASGGEDRQIKLWEMATGRAVETLGGFHNDVSSITFSPDGKLLAAGSLGQTVKVWKLSGAQVIKTLRLTEISYNSVAFSPEGQWLALGSRDLQLWLKVLLTEEEYATVKDGEARALIAKDEAAARRALSE